MSTHRFRIAIAAALILGTSITMSSPAAAAEPDLGIDPTTIDFGDVLVGETVERTVTITNNGTAPFGPIRSFGSATSTDEFQAASGCQGKTLDVRGSCTMTFSFTPSEVGPLSDASAPIFRTDAGEEVNFRIDLTGNGVAPNLIIDPTSIDFGDVLVGETVEKTVTVTNNGTAPFGPIDSFGGAPNSDEFATATACQGKTLDPGESCEDSYGFTPSDVGPFSDESNFIFSQTDDQDDGFEFTVKLTGNGVEAPVTTTTTSEPAGTTTSEPAGTTTSAPAGGPTPTAPTGGEGSPTPPGTGGATTLPRTGAATLPIALMGFALLAAGAVFVATARRHAGNPG